MKIYHRTSSANSAKLADECWSEVKLLTGWLAELLSYGLLNVLTKQLEKLGFAVQLEPVKLQLEPA